MNVKVDFEGFDVTDTSHIGNVKVVMLKGESGEPTQEMTNTAVNAWLTAHPEATTTVQDGSITEAKLSQSVINKINEGGMSSAAKQALLALLEMAVYLDDDAPGYLATLENEWLGS